MMAVETYLDGRVTLHCGDCLDRLKEIPDDSIDSGVMDPPYHLTSIVKRFGNNQAPAQDGKTGAFKRASAGFMGQTWDGGDIAFTPELWCEIYRVLKPGAYLLAFASTRGIWRMGVAIEDAGFIPHPMNAWLFGSGYQKATRNKADGYDGFRYGGQSLKPAIEPVFMGQKPFEAGLNGTENILTHGTGAVNIDGCRIQGGGEVKPRGSSKLDTNMHEGWARPWMQDREKVQAAHDAAIENANRLGRWPANVIHDGSDEVLAAFPGNLKSGSGAIKRTTGVGYSGTVYGSENRPAGTEGVAYGDEGSAARFFYSAKADADDRIGSKHPTVKPIDLMRYLVRLVTPPGGTVLDAFAGTGTTGEAAFYEGFKAVLIEREPDFQDDIRRRMKLCLAGPDERAREILKAKHQDDPEAFKDSGPLFNTLQKTGETAC